MPSPNNEVGVLQQRFELHSSPEVLLAIGQAAAHGEKLPNEPEATIDHYLGQLGARHSLFSAQVPHAEERQQRQIAARVIGFDQMPESHFEHMRQRHRANGLGDLRITQQMRIQEINAVQENQTETLKSWVGYLSDETTPYPNWFSYYAYRGVLKMGAFNSAKKLYEPRTATTTAPYPELNPEALAQVYTVVSEQGAISASFARLYAKSLSELNQNQTELSSFMRGEWVKYPQGQDNNTIKELTAALAGRNTTWCTAQPGVAKTHLQAGDFYVFYTYDKHGNATQPRIAVRMLGSDTVAEIRGILPFQNLEPEAYPIAAEKIRSIPGTEKYQHSIDDMCKVTEIAKRFSDGDFEMTVGELQLLYQIDRPIYNILGKEDPRVLELIKQRDMLADWHLLKPDATDGEIIQHHFRHKVAQYTELRSVFFESNCQLSLATARSIFQATPDSAIFAVINYTKNFAELDEAIARQLLAKGELRLIINNISKFEYLSNEIAKIILESGDIGCILRNQTIFKDFPTANFVHNYLNTRPYKTSRTVAAFIDRLSGLSLDTANILIAHGYGKVVVRNPQAFVGIDTTSPQAQRKIAGILKGRTSKLDPLLER